MFFIGLCYYIYSSMVINSSKKSHFVTALSTGQFISGVIVRGRVLKVDICMSFLCLLVLFCICLFIFGFVAAQKKKNTFAFLSAL